MTIQVFEFSLSYNHLESLAPSSIDATLMQQLIFETIEIIDATLILMQHCTHIDMRNI